MFALGFFTLLIVVLASTPAGVWLMDQWGDQPTGIRLTPAMLVVVTAAEFMRLLVQRYARQARASFDETVARPKPARRFAVLWGLIAIAWITFLYPWPFAVRFVGYASELESAAVLDARGGPALRRKTIGPVLVRRVRSEVPPSLCVLTADESDWIHRLMNRSDWGQQDRAIGLRYDPEHTRSRGRRWLFGAWYIE